MFERVLIIAAHPDDDILGCGGFISKFSSTSAIKVIFLCEGSSVRFLPDMIDDINKASRLRSESALAALNFLGVFDVEFYNLPCGSLDQIPLSEVNKLVESAICDFSPSVVLTHSHTDSNQDHTRLYDSCVIATRPGLNSVQALLSFEVLSSTEWGFKSTFIPNVFISLDRRDLNNKIREMSFYTDEIRPYPFPRSRKGIYTLASYRGIQSGCNFSEAYHASRMVYL